MGIFNIKRNHKSKKKSKESTIVEEKSKNGFHFSSIFKFSNKKKKTAKNNLVSKDDNLPKQEQGYYFVSYQKNLAISRTSSNIDNQNNLVKNPYNNIKTIEYIQTTMNPVEEQVNKKINIQEVNTSSSNSPESKNVHSDSNIEVVKTETSEEKTACASQIPDHLQPTQISNEEIGSSLVTCKPKHISSMSQLSEFIKNEEENLEEFSSSNEESREEITSITASFSKEKSTLLNIEGRNNIEIISDDEVKPVESDAPSSTQATLGKDTSLTTNTLSSEMIELNTSSMSGEMKPEIINISSIEEVTDVNKSLTESSHEKRKRSDSQSTQNTFQESSESMIQEKKIRKNKKRGSKDPNFVKNHKKRMGIITGSCGPIIQDTSIVQGVKGPWKIVETTTMTAGIAASPELIHRAFGNATIAQTNQMIIRSPSLPSLNKATFINQKLITRHQIVSDSLVEEVNVIQKKCSSSSLDDQNSISDQDSDHDSFPFNYHNDRTTNEINSFHHSDPIARKKSSPKLFIQNLKSLKAVLKHDSKKLNQNNEKRSSRMTINEINYPSSQSQVISTSTNSENINVNTTNTNTYSNITSTMNSTTNVNMNTDIPNSTITTTNYNHSNHQEGNSNALFQDTANNNIPNSSSSQHSSPIQDELSTESPISHSFTIIKYHLNKPSYLEDEQSKKITDSHWNSDITMKARYHITSDYDHDQNISIYQMRRRRPVVRNTSVQQVEEPSTIERKDESGEQLSSLNNDSSCIQTKKKKSYNEEIVKPILDKARKRKNIQRRKNWPKKFRSNENLRNSKNDPSVSYDNMTTFATITSLGKNEGDGSSSHADSFYDNYYLGLSYINNEKSIERHHLDPDVSSQSKNTIDINDQQRIIENEQHPSNDENDNGHDSNDESDNDNNNDNRDNDHSRIIEKHEEADMNDTTYNSLEFKDTVISSVENDNTSTSQPNNSISSSKFNSILPNNSISIHKSNFTLPFSKGKSPSLPTTSRQTFPRLIDVPGNSSMIKAYAMKNVDENIEEQYFDNSLLTPLTNYSTAGATAANDTMQPIQSITQQIPSQHADNAIQILATQCTQKTSTCSYLPLELLESSENMNITNFQIHTCKDSVLSPLIPCIACSNENKWKNKSLSTKFRDRFKKWKLVLSHSKKRNDKSMEYTSSAMLTVPIYFGDQLASPEDQSRHRSGDSSKKGSSSSIRSKRLKKSISSSSFLFPNKATQNPLPITNYVPPTVPTLHPLVIESKTSSEILPIANDINKKNSSVRIKKIVKQSTKPIHTLPRGERTVSLQNKILKQKQMEKDKSLSRIRPKRKTSNSYIDNRHKGIIYYTNSRKVLEKDALSHHGSAQKMALKGNEDLKKRINSKVSAHDGYNETIFSRPITPELEPTGDNGGNVNVDAIVPPLKSKPSNISVSISTTTSSYSVPIKQFVTSTIPTKNLQSKQSNRNQSNRHSEVYKSLYKDVCVLGLNIDHLAEKDSSNLNKKNNNN